MPEQELNFIISAINKSETAFKEVEASFAGLQEKLKQIKPAFKAIATAGTVAFGAVTAVVATSVNAFAESERSQRQLEHANIDVSKGTKEQVAEVNKLSTALQK